MLCSQTVRLLILGEGPERRNLLRLAEELGIAEHVDLPGFRVNPFAYMAKSRLMAHSSRYEGFPNVLVQAMACGTPVVSTDCRHGPGEILEGGKWGRLVPVGDPDAMAEAIIETLKDPIEPVRLVSRASVYSAEAAIDRYMQVVLPRADCRKLSAAECGPGEGAAIAPGYGGWLGNGADIRAVAGDLCSLFLVCQHPVAVRGA